MSLQVNFPDFMAAWVPITVASAVTPAPDLGQFAVVELGGLPVPVITCALGFLGVVMARPFARRGEAELSLPLFLLCSAIMLILVQLWIIESRPSWLFAFAVAIGLGFSGYSLLELMGEQIQQFMREVFTRAKSTIGLGPKSGDGQ